MLMQQKQPQHGVNFLESTAALQRDVAEAVFERRQLGTDLNRGFAAPASDVAHGFLGSFFEFRSKSRNPFNHPKGSQTTNAVTCHAFKINRSLSYCRIEKPGREPNGKYHNDE